MLAEWTLSLPQIVPQSVHHLPAHMLSHPCHSSTALLAMLWSNMRQALIEFVLLLFCNKEYFTQITHVCVHMPTHKY